MSNYFTLGGISFAWTPSGIDYGYGHHVVRHDLIGGGRTFDLMGDNPDDIVIMGTLTGPTQFTDRDAVKKMIGTRQTLVWGADSQSVIILKAPYKQSFSALEYTITCSVVVTPTTAPVTALSVATVAVSQASALTLPPSVSTPLTAASTAMTTVNPLAALAPLQTAQTAATGIVSMSDSVIAGFNPAAAGGTMSVYQFTNGLQSSAAAYQNRAPASQASGLISAAITNLTA
jgi:hypothetical protein